MCGNMMRGLDANFLTELCAKVHQRQARLVIDMEALSPQLIERCRPDLIKLNFYEFKLLTGQPGLTLADLPDAPRSCGKAVWTTSSFRWGRKARCW